jgi:sulfite reductase alpha subunit-like flavoprotein
LDWKPEYAKVDEVTEPKHTFGFVRRISDVFKKKSKQLIETVTSKAREEHMKRLLENLDKIDKKIVKKSGKQETTPQTQSPHERTLQICFDQIVW